MTPAERQLRARLGAYASWANCDDWSARTAPGRAGLERRFEQLALEKHPGLTGPELAKYAEAERRRFYAELAFKSARARRRRSTTGEP